MKYKEHRRKQVFYILLLFSSRGRNFRSMDPILIHEDKAWEKSVVSVRKCYTECNCWKYNTKVEETMADEGMRVIAGVY